MPFSFLLCFALPRDMRTGESENWQQLRSGIRLRSLPSEIRFRLRSEARGQQERVVQKEMRTATEKTRQKVFLLPAFAPTSVKRRAARPQKKSEGGQKHTRRVKKQEDRLCHLSTGWRRIQARITVKLSASAFLFLLQLAVSKNQQRKPRSIPLRS